MQAGARHDLLCCKMMSGLLSIKIYVHVIDNSDNVISAGGGVIRDEKQSSLLPGLCWYRLINF